MNTGQQENSLQPRCLWIPAIASVCFCVPFFTLAQMVPVRFFERVFLKISLDTACFVLLFVCFFHRMTNEHLLHCKGCIEQNVEE